MDTPPTVTSQPQQPTQVKVKAESRPRTKRSDTKEFMRWYLHPVNQERCSTFTNGRVAQEYQRVTGVEIRPACIAYNKDRWVLYKGELMRRELTEHIALSFDGPLKTSL